MKTIFLFLRQGISNRNLLRTDFLKTLKSHPGIRVVIFSPIGNESEFRKELEAENVCVELWPRTRVGFWEKRLKNLKNDVWLADARNNTFRIKQRAARGVAAYLWHLLLGKFLLFVRLDQRRINRWEMAIFRSDSKIRELYERYQPVMVLFTRVFGTNLHVIKEAKRRGIAVVCLVESWDNLTHKGPLSVIPDRLVVWNSVNREEALSLHGFQGEEVVVAGVPQFDIYHGRAIGGSREDFFKSLSIDPGLKLILYATSTEGNSPEEIDTVKLLFEALRRGDIKKPAHIVIRLHPISSPKLVDQYFSIFKDKPGITLQRPGRPAKLHDGWDPTWSDMLELAQTLYHSDLLINVASTITLDAACFDTPTVCVAFDGECERKGYYESCRRIYDYACWRNVVRTGGVRVASTPEEMIQSINAYLEKPALDADGRALLRREQAYLLDGRSAERMAKFVLGEIGVLDKKALVVEMAACQKDERETSCPR